MIVFLQIIIENVKFQVDCTFGSGSVIDGKFKHEFSRLYFFPAPEQLILTHWIQDEGLQLLEYPITLPDLQQLIAPTLETFSKGIIPTTYTRSIELKYNSITTAVHVKCSTDLVITANLHNVLDRSEIKNCNGNSLVFIQRINDGVIIRAAVPGKGRFILDVNYAEKGSILEMRSTAHCISYLLTSEMEVVYSEFTGFPTVYEHSALELDFSICTLQEPNGHICKTENKLEMSVKANSNANISHCICRKVDSDPNLNMRQGLELKCFTRLFTDPVNPEIQHLTVIFPSKGWWTISLYYKKNTVMEYHVYATCVLHNTIFPFCTKTGKEIGISLASSDALTYATDGKPIKINFTARPHTLFQVELKDFNDEGECEDICAPEKCTYIKIPSDGNTVHTLCAVPPRGIWSLLLFARDAHHSFLRSVLEIKPLNFSLALSNDYYPEFTGYPVVNSTAAAKSGFVLRDWNGGEDEFKCRTLNRIHMNLNVASDKKLNHYITKQKYSENGSDNRLQCYTNICTSKSDMKLRKLTVILPSQGWYTVIVSDSDTRFIILQYEVYATSGMKNVLYPTMTEDATTMGVSRVDDDVPISYRDTEPVSIKFTAPSGPRYGAQLKSFEFSQQDNPKSDIKYCTLVSPQPRNGVYTVHSVLPRGSWKLIVYANGTPVICTEPLDRLSLDSNCAYPIIFRERIQEFSVIIPESTYVKKSDSGLFQYSFNAPLDVNFSFSLTKDISNTRMEKNHVVMTKPGGNSSTENRINVLVPGPGKWTLTVFATKQSMKKIYSVFQLFFEATMGQTESIIFPYVTTEFTSMSLFPPLNIREWMLPQSVAKSEYPKQIEIKFIQDTEDIQLHCNAVCDQQECFDAISLRHDNDPEQKYIKRTLVITMQRRGEWKFTLRGRYMHEEKSIQIELLSYSVKGM